MWGVIRRVEIAGVSALEDIAGKPLVSRQLLWLRSMGCEKVVVEIGPGDDGIALLAYLDHFDALGADVVSILSPRPLGIDGLGARAGIGIDVPRVVIDSDVLGDTDATTLFSGLDGRDREARPGPPAPRAATGHAFAPGSVGVRRAGRDAEEVGAEGWTVRLRDRADAFALTCGYLSGELGARELTLPGTAITPGIYMGRGAVIEAGAEVRGPVLIGPGAIVRSGARVGPFVVLGARAVVERGAVVEEAHVAPEVLVGEGLALRDVAVDASGIEPLTPGERTSIELGDALLLAPRELASQHVPLRIVAAILWVALAPFLAWTAQGRATWARVQAAARGERTLLGVSESLPVLAGAEGLRSAAARAPLGCIDVEPLITHPGASVADRLRARAWYAVAKNTRLDAALLLRWFFRSPAPRTLGSIPGAA
jgi:hypothetical protein